MIELFRSRLLSLPRRAKQIVLVAFDVVALSAALWASFCLRYDNWYLPRSVDEILIIATAPLVAVPIFIRMGLYRAVVRYLPERAFGTIIQAMLFATLAWVLLVFLSEMAGRGVVPRSVPIIFFGLGTFFVVGSRFLAKVALRSRAVRQGTLHKSVLIYGANEVGVQLVQSLRATHDVVGFVDDNSALHGRELAGTPVFPTSRLGRLAADHDISELIVSVSSLSSQRRKEIVSQASQHGIKVHAVPAIADLVTGKYQVSQIKEIDVVELLGRSSVPPDPSLIRSMIVGRSILVTGAGGSIGSELCRKIAQWNPQRLVLFEANEFALYQIDRELAALPDIVVIPVLGSVVDRELMRRTIAAHDIEVVFHAAAHKHVPLVEANVLEGVKNNVFGTAAVADVAFECGVENFVLISTDKAVRPTNVMGATKRWAELIIADKARQALENQTGQRFCAVRFGNVLGSNGSVVPLFKRQIAQGGPLTVTDAAMTRYFMSIQEAAELIVQAGSLSQGGDVFLLDMGEPMLITDLAENMIRLAGLTLRNEANPHGDIEIVLTGKRPGEKLYEELFYDPSHAVTTDHPKIMRAAPAARKVVVEEVLVQLQQHLDEQDEQAVRKLLFDVVNRSVA